MADAGVAIIVRVQAREADHKALKQYHARNTKALAHVVGYHSMTVWQSMDEEDQYLVLIEFSDERCADLGLKASMDVGPLVAQLGKDTDPPDVRRTRVVSRALDVFGEVPVGSYASVSIRTADPGYGSDLVDDLERVFGELAMLDGFLGHAICRNSAFREEVIGLAFWSSEESFRQSLPSSHKHMVKAFCRIL